MTTAIVAFTARGVELALRIAPLYEGATVHGPQKYCRDGVEALEGGVGQWTADHFPTCRLLVYIGAAGIAVRAIAPHLVAKTSDPAVLCVDDTGKFVIPLVSGHIGGANRHAWNIAGHLGAQAVITTATDGHSVFSVDEWAAEGGYHIMDKDQIKHIAAALLDGEPVGFRSDFPVEGQLPKGITARQDTACGIEIALAAMRPFAHTLHLAPRCVVAGIGCRKGMGADRIEALLRQQLEAHGIPLEAVGTVASIDLKAGEPGLVELCGHLHVPLVTFSPARLMAQAGDFAASPRVLAATGADNVCERAAVAAGGVLFSGKAAQDGVTVALARTQWNVIFDQEASI